MRWKKGFAGSPENVVRLSNLKKTMLGLSGFGESESNNTCTELSNFLIFVTEVDDFSLLNPEDADP